MGKSADTLTGFIYPTGGGNDINIYKQPMKDPNSADITKRGNQMDDLNISVGGITKRQMGEKTDGIKIRGTGAATKGTKSRGPMA
jgi:hypothetical protein